MKAVPVEVAVARAKGERLLKKAILSEMVSGEQGNATAHDIEECRREIRKLDDFIDEYSASK